MKKHSGFTIIELMIVVAIIGVIAAIAIPSYLDYMDEADEGQAKASALGLKPYMEQYFLETGTYVSGDGEYDNDELAAIFGWDSANVGDNVYTVTAEATTWEIQIETDRDNTFTFTRDQL